MQIAALYDIHGNLPALEAVLADVEADRPDLVLVGGDLVAGPFPAECLDALRALEPNVVFIRGNGDREVVAGGEGERGWCVERLGTERADFVTAWPLLDRREVDGLGRVLFCHATPHSDEAFITPATPEEAVAEELADAEADVVVYGHIHVQYERGERRRGSSIPAASAGRTRTAAAPTGRCSDRTSTSGAPSTTTSPRPS